MYILAVFSRRSDLRFDLESAIVFQFPNLNRSWPCTIKSVGIYGIFIITAHRRAVDTQFGGAGKLMALSELGIGQDAVVSKLDLPEEVQHHLMHMGFIPEARVTALRRAPAGDPTVYAIDGLEIALRRDTAGAIRVRQLDSPKTGESAPTNEGAR